MGRRWTRAGSAPGCHTLCRRGLSFFLLAHARLPPPRVPRLPPLSRSITLWAHPRWLRCPHPDREDRRASPRPLEALADEQGTGPPVALEGLIASGIARAPQATAVDVTARHPRQRRTHSAPSGPLQSPPRPPAHRSGSPTSSAPFTTGSGHASAALASSRPVRTGRQRDTRLKCRRRSRPTPTPTEQARSFHLGQSPACHMCGDSPHEGGSPSPRAARATPGEPSPGDMHDDRYRVLRSAAPAATAGAAAFAFAFGERVLGDGIQTGPLFCAVPAQGPGLLYIVIRDR